MFRWNTFLETDQARRLPARPGQNLDRSSCRTTGYLFEKPLSPETQGAFLRVGISTDPQMMRLVTQHEYKYITNCPATFRMFSSRIWPPVSPAYVPKPQIVVPGLSSSSSFVSSLSSSSSSVSSSLSAGLKPIVYDECRTSSDPIRLSQRDPDGLPYYFRVTWLFEDADNGHIMGCIYVPFLKVLVVVNTWSAPDEELTKTIQVMRNGDPDIRIDLWPPHMFEGNVQAVEGIYSRGLCSDFSLVLPYALAKSGVFHITDEQKIFDQDEDIYRNMNEKAIAVYESMKNTPVSVFNELRRELGLL